MELDEYFILLFLRIWRDKNALPDHDPGGPEKEENGSKQ
jgi:hypothetical protein